MTEVSLKAIARRYGWNVVDGILTPPPAKPGRVLSKAQRAALLSALKNGGVYETTDTRSAIILVDLGLMTHTGSGYMRLSTAFRLTTAGIVQAEAEDRE